MRARLLAGLAAAAMTTAACGGASGGSEAGSGKTPSPTSSTPPAASTSPTPTQGASGTGGRLLLVPGDTVSGGGRCTPQPRRGVVCSADRATTYRFQPQALRSIGVASASATYLSDGATWVVRVTADQAGRTALARVTRSAAGSRQVVLLLLPGSRQLLAAPQVQEPITGSELQITGDFTESSASLIVRQITSDQG